MKIMSKNGKVLDRMRGDFEKIKTLEKTLSTKAIAESCQCSKSKVNSMKRCETFQEYILFLRESKAITQKNTILCLLREANQLIEEMTTILLEVQGSL